MNKNLISFLILFAFLPACNSYTPTKDIFNHHLTSQLGYEVKMMSGVHKVDDTHNTSEAKKANHLIKLLQASINTDTKYTYQYNQDGTNYRTYLNDDPDYAIKFEYGRKKELFSIAGYHPAYIKEVFDYHKDGYIKYIFREKGENVLYKYTEDHKIISCYTFRPIKDGSKRALRPEKLIAQMHLKNYENGSFVIQVNDAGSGEEIEKYTYAQMILIKKEIMGGELISYEYDDYDNVLKISHILPDKKSLNYNFEYYYDNNDNWIDRQIILDDTLILRTERAIKYY